MKSRWWKAAPLALALALGGQAVGQDDDLAQAIELPAAAKRLRDAGVPPAEVAKALRAERDEGLSAGEAADMADAAAKAVEAHGPVDNFGAFVQERLDEGLRGQDLAAAIRSEHQARGAKEKDKEKGGPDGAGPDGEKGKPEGRPEGGKPDGKAGGGKPDGRPAGGKGGGKGSKAGGGGH